MQASADLRNTRSIPGCGKLGKLLKKKMKIVDGAEWQIEQNELKLHHLLGSSELSGKGENIRDAGIVSSSLTAPPSSLSIPSPFLSSRVFIDNPRILIRIPIYQFDMTNPIASHFPAVLPLPSPFRHPRPRFFSASHLALIIFLRWLNGQTETFEARGHKGDEFSTAV